MGYASYAENIAEKFNERLADLLKVASQVKRGPASGEDLSIAHQQKLQQVLTDLAGLLGKLLGNLDDPAVAAKLSSKNLSEALSHALSQSEHLEATNRELHRQLADGKKQGMKSAQALEKARGEAAALEGSNAKLRKANREAKEAISKLQKTLKQVEGEHLRKIDKTSRDVALLNGKIRDLENRNENLEKQLFVAAVRDVRPIKKK